MLNLILQGEVIEIKREFTYENGYDKPGVYRDFITVSLGVTNGRYSGSVKVPGNLPLGTRFDFTLNQTDVVAPGIPATNPYTEA